MFICKGKVAGNSTVTLQWAVTTTSRHSTIPQAAIDDEYSVTNLTQEAVDTLCQAMSGAFSLPLQSFLAPNNSSADRFVFLHLRTALLLCGGTASLSNTYSCFAVNTTQGVEYRVFLTITVPSNLLSLVIAIVVVILVVAVIAIVVTNWCCFLRYRSKKCDPTPMTPQNHLPSFPHRRAVGGFPNPILDVVSDATTLETDSNEFPRDRLHLISVLGE